MRDGFSWVVEVLVEGRISRVETRIVASIDLAVGWPNRIRFDDRGNRIRRLIARLPVSLCWWITLPTLFAFVLRIALGAAHMK